MALIVPLIGEKRILDQYLAIGDLKIDLFQNNYTPVSGSLLANFTVATYSGYAQQTLTAAAWTAAADDGTGRAFSTNVLKIFNNTTGVVGNQIYGYYVRDAAGNLLWAERFTGAPIDFTFAGAALYLLPILTLKSEF